MYMYTYWRLGGESFCDPNREIDFGFGFVSCVTCVRAGEAKLCVRARGDEIPVLGLNRGKSSPPAPAPPARPCRSGCPRVVRKFSFKTKWFFKMFRGKPIKNNEKSTFFADNRLKPMKNQHFSRPTD